MSKRKPSMDIDNVMNDINKWLDDLDDEAEDDLNEVNGDKENEQIFPSKKNASVDEIDFHCDDSNFSQYRPIYRKQLTHKGLVHSIDSSLSEINFEPFVYVNRNGNFETFTGYFDLKANKNTKKISWDKDVSFITGRQRPCDAIHRPISFLLSNTKASNIETFDDTFHLFLDDQIMDMIVHNTNNKMRERLSRLRNNHSAFINSIKNPYVEETDHIETNALFGLMCLKGILSMNLQRVDYLFANERHYVFGEIMSKNRFKSLLSHSPFGNHIDRENNQPTDRFAAMRLVWELSNSNRDKYLTSDATLYPMRHQIAFR